MNYQEHLNALVTNEYQIFYLAVTVLVCCTITVYLARRVSWFSRAAQLGAPVLLTAGAFAAGPGIAMLTALAAVIGSRSRWPSRLSSTWLLGLLALIVRLPFLSTSMWYDETFTARIVSLDWSQLGTAIMADIHPPTYYILTWLWARFAGFSDAALRIPTLIFGVIAVLLFRRLAESAGLSRRAAFVAGAIMAVLPSAIFYGVELRPYMLLTCMVFAALIAILENRPAVFAVTTGSLLWLHNLGAFHIAVLIVLALIRHRANAGWRIAIIAAGLISGIWLPFAVVQSQYVADGFWTHALNIGAVLKPLLLAVRTTPGPLVWILSIALLALLIVSAYAARRWIASPTGKLLMTAALLTPALVALVSVVWHPVYVDRAFLPCTLLLFLPVAYVVAEQRAARAIVAPFLLLALVGMFADDGRPDYGRLIEQGCRSSDAYYATSMQGAFIGSRYAPAPTFVWPGAENTPATEEAYDLHGAYGFWIAEPSFLTGRRVCFMLIDQYFTTTDERQFIEAMTTGRPVWRQAFVLNRDQTLRFYIVEL